jgi:hypothetical protein
MLKRVDTGTHCVVCHKEIVATVGTTWDVSRGERIIGPGSRNQMSEKVLSFHCSNVDCGLRYEHPPGHPNAVTEILG